MSSTISENYVKRHKNKIIVGIFFILGIITIRTPAIFVGPDLDASGLVALAWFKINNFQVGEEILAHIGPLAYLMMPVYIEPNLWFQALLESVFVHFFFVISFALFVIKLKGGWKDNIIVFALFVTLSYLITISAKIDEQVMFSSVLLLYLIISDKLSNKYSAVLLIVIGSILSIESLIKFNLTIASIGIITIYSLISFSKKDIKKPIILILTYIISLTIFWITSGQNVSNLPNYFVDGLMVSSGYSYAMAIDGPIVQTISAIISISFILILFTYSIVKRYHNLTIFVLLSGLVLFLAFKHGFVRHDGHVLYFYFAYGVFFISTYLIYKYDLSNLKKNKKEFALIAITLIAAILCVVSIDIISPKLIAPDITRDRVAWGEVWPLIVDSNYQENRLSEHREMLKHHLPLEEKISKDIGSKTMDIFPYDIMIPWLHDLNWDPRPMPWAFQVFNPEISRINAQHFLKQDSPEKILYSHKSIDGRYPVFDEPETFQAIIQNYEYTDSSNDFILLTKNYSKNSIEKINLKQSIEELGKSIKIPKYHEGYLFANVDLEFSTLGKILYTMYKPSQVHFIFKFNDSTYSKEFRFIPGVSSEGLFVSQYVDNVNEIKSILSGNISNDIDEIIIWADIPSHYIKNFEVTFFGMPANITLQEVEQPQKIDWEKLNQVEGGLMTIDFIGNILVAHQNSDIEISKSKSEYVGINGWAVDGLSQDGTVNAFIVLENNEEKIILPTHKNHRPDVAKFFEVEKYEFSGWSTAIKNEDFDGCYEISIRIPRNNGLEYFEILEDKSICFTK